jgi:hypothetical protein
MLMWILVTATACALVIWGAIDHWTARHDSQAPKRWPPVTILSDDAALDGTAPIRPIHAEGQGVKTSAAQSRSKAEARIAAFFARMISGLPFARS